MKGMLVFSWGGYGGFYAKRHKITRLGSVRRLCLGWVAIDLYPVEVEDIFRDWIERKEEK